ncbi:MAG TPA: alkaline phosphatase family protein [Verrucomicrobiae bacterium]|nr:alkaline phosphatase family protein [Verrucomicrobiae bacterium]
MPLVEFGRQKHRGESFSSGKGKLKNRWLFVVLGGLVISTGIARASTIITNTRAQVAQMAGWWEVDSVQISSLANAQYPQFTNTWEYMSPSGSTSSDGDEHINMAVDSSNTGATGGNQGESPIVPEIINASGSLLPSGNTHAKARGIFRFYTEHASERKYEIHPMTERDVWNASSNAFILANDYHNTIAFDANGTTHSASTLQQMFTQNVTAQVMADNTNVIFTFTSPNTNYGQFGGLAQSGLLNDSISPYFWFTPTNPAVATTVRCRLITNTAAAFNATGLTSNQAVTVNILTRWDMLGISNKIASLTANQSSTFPTPIEFITLSVSSTGVVSSLPIISNVQATGLTLSNATIQWTTDVSSDSQVLYGTSPSSVTNPASGAAGTTNHVVNLTGLQPGTLYYFSVSSTSTGGTTVDDNQGAFYTFNTLSPLTPQSVQTVFIILEENQNWASISGNAAAPYINNGLLPKSSYTLQYYNPPGIHPSLPNYLWLEAGTNFGILADGDPSSFHQSTTNHLVTLLKNAGVSWTSYQEDISGTTCPLTSVNQYAPKHNPMVYFDDVTNTNNTGSAYCIANVRPYTELATDLQSNIVTRYNFITPNLCDDMHGNTGCLTGNALITAGDTWLSNTVAAIVSSQAYSNNGVIFVTWDEGEGGDGPIGMIVLSSLAKGGGYSNTNHYTHSSTLLTMQEIFNVGPLLGDAVNAIDLSDLFVFGAKLAVSPASGLTSSGTVGGPFSPTSQIYTLSNTGGVAMAWTVSNTANWLTLSATSGSLAAGGSTNITVSINANANSLVGGVYSDTVSFNTSNGSGNTTRPVSLTVNNVSSQLSVSPASGFSSAGAPGGPFSPASQVYTVSNIGGATMNWTANNSANWLTLSATSGTLAPSASTNITATINANANSLTAGNYTDAIGFTNTTSGAGNTTRAVSLNVSSFGFYDDFSTFSSGNLVGQHSWTQVGTISSSALQVNNGKVIFAGGLTASGQTGYKNFTLTNETVYYGLTLTVSNAVNSGSVSYFAALYTSNNATGFANYRLSAKDTGTGTYLLGARVTGQSGNPYTFGTTPLSYGTQYRVIVQASAAGTNVIVYVNPSSSNQGAQTQYANNPVGSGTPPTSVGCFVISQFGTATIPSDGGSVGKAVVADSFATVYNDLLGALPPVASFSGSPTSGTEPLLVTFSDTSTGTITNRFWNFGDASTTNTTTNSVAHTYAAGSYTVMLVASGPGGGSTNTQVNYINVLTAFQSWQVQYFGSTNNANAAPGVDADGTGQNNLFKYVAGLDPTNPASVFQLQVVAVTNQASQENLLFNPFATGRTYKPQFSTDLVGNAWLPLPGYLGPITNGNQISVTDTNAVDPARFYRIDISLP